MSDYTLTAGQQQELVAFLNAGKSIYVEGTDFGYFHRDTTFYKMFGCTYLGDGNSSYNVQTLTGMTDTLMEGARIDYTYGSSYPDQFVDYIGSNGGDLFFQSQDGRYRAVAYAGPDGSYRAVHLTYWFGAMKDQGASHTKAEIMAAIMHYLRKDTLVLAVEDEISVSQGGEARLMIEADASAGGRDYAILGSMSGTAPGMQVGGVTLPLNPDYFMSIVYHNLNSPVFQDFHGTSSGAGRAIGTLHVNGPLNPGLAGRTVNFAYLLLNPVDFASNPVDIHLVP